MRLLIVGVGQTFNFETKSMDDMLQVRAPDGTLLSIPTTNDAAQALVQMAMNGEGEPQRVDLQQAYEQSGGSQVRAVPDAEDFPDGAEIFGGGQVAALSQSTEGRIDQDEEPAGMGDPELEQQIFRKTQQTQGASASLGRRRNPTDKSGVPSMSIARVDEKGNPVLPAAPDHTMDDEEDPGEQI